MGVGAGELYFVMTATVVILLVLLVFPQLEARIDRIREARTYKIVIKVDDHKKVVEVEKAFRDCSLRIFEQHQAKSEKIIIGTWKTIGTPANHEKFVQLMIKDKRIKELTPWRAVPGSAGVSFGTVRNISC